MAKKYTLEELKKMTKFTYKDGKDFDLEQFTALIRKMYANYMKENQLK